jgi:hypothetical protein
MYRFTSYWVYPAATCRQECGRMNILNPPQGSTRTTPNRAMIVSVFRLAACLATMLLASASIAAATPSAVINSAPDVTSAGGISYQFSVTYSDPNAISIPSIGDGDVSVSGPGGFSQAATLVFVDINSNGTPRTATYNITPPGGSWDSADDGTYTLAMNANQVFNTDSTPLAVPAGTLGTFNVNIPEPTVLLPLFAGATLLGRRARRPL